MAEEWELVRELRNTALLMRFDVSWLLDSGELVTTVRAQLHVAPAASEGRVARVGARHLKLLTASSRGG